MADKPRHSWVRQFEFSRAYSRRADFGACDSFAFYNLMAVGPEKWGLVATVLIPKTQGDNDDYCITGEIDVLSLRQFQSSHRPPASGFKPVQMALTRTWHAIEKYYPKGLRPDSIKDGLLVSSSMLILGY